MRNEQTQAPLGERDTKEWKRPILRLAYRTDEAAAALGIGTTKFEEWVKRKMLPGPVKIDGVVLYDAEELKAAWTELARRARGERPDREVASVDLSAGWNARSGL